jgi:hypothetical protein
MHNKLWVAEQLMLRPFQLIYSPNSLSSPFSFSSITQNEAQVRTRHQNQWAFAILPHIVDSAAAAPKIHQKDVVLRLHLIRQ